MRMEPKAAQRQVEMVTAARRHTGFVQDGGVDEDDVRHRDEGGETREGLGSPGGGAVLVEFEVVFEAGFERRHSVTGWCWFCCKRQTPR